MLYRKVLVCVYVHVSNNRMLSDTETERVSGKDCGLCFLVVSVSDCFSLLLFTNGWACLFLHGSVLSKHSDVNKYHSTGTSSKVKSAHLSPVWVHRWSFVVTDAWFFCNDKETGMGVCTLMYAQAANGLTKAYVPAILIGDSRHRPSTSSHMGVFRG